MIPARLRPRDVPIITIVPTPQRPQIALLSLTFSVRDPVPQAQRREAEKIFGAQMITETPTAYIRFQPQFAAEFGGKDGGRI